MRRRCRPQPVLVKLWLADAGCHTYSFNSSKGSPLHCSTPRPQAHVTFPRLAHQGTGHSTANPLIPRSPEPLPPATFSKAFSPCPRVIQPRHADQVSPPSAERPRAHHRDVCHHGRECLRNPPAKTASFSSSASGPRIDNHHHGQPPTSKGTQRSLPQNQEANDPLHASPPSSVHGVHAPPPLPQFPHMAFKVRRGYQKPNKALVPLPTMLSFISHNIAKQPPTSHILRRLKQGYDVIFFVEVLKKPLVPHSFASGNDRAVIVSNVSSKREQETCLALSPRRRPFVEPIARLDKEGLIAAALLHLPGAPPILVAIVYSPYKASRLDMQRLRSTVGQSLQPLLVKYPYHVLGGDFNTMVTPSLDGHNMCSGCPWNWLASKVTSSPPPFR